MADIELTYSQAVQRWDNLIQNGDVKASAFSSVDTWILAGCPEDLGTTRIIITDWEGHEILGPIHYLMKFWYVLLLVIILIIIVVVI